MHKNIYDLFYVQFYIFPSLSFYIRVQVNRGIFREFHSMQSLLLVGHMQIEHSYWSWANGAFLLVMGKYSILIGHGQMEHSYWSTKDKAFALFIGQREIDNTH